MVEDSHGICCFRDGCFRCLVRADEIDPNVCDMVVFWVFLMRIGVVRFGLCTRVGVVRVLRVGMLMRCKG